MRDSPFTHIKILFSVIIITWYLRKSNRFNRALLPLFSAVCNAFVALDNIRHIVVPFGFGRGWGSGLRRVGL